MTSDIGRLDCLRMAPAKGPAKLLPAEIDLRSKARTVRSNLGPVRTGGQRAMESLRCRSVSFVRVAAASTASIATRLVVPDLKLQFGERIKCVGQSAALGSWYLSAAPVLNWTEGNNWVHHLHLPPGTHEFKLLIARDDGSTHWEQGENRTVEVPEHIDGLLEVKCSFADTSSTEVSTLPLQEKDGKSIKGSRQGATERSWNGLIRANGDLPDALEGDSTEREPDSVSDTRRYGRPNWQEQQKKDDNDEALEGVSPPSSDPTEQTEPSPDDKNVTQNYRRNGTYGSYRNGAVRLNGSATHRPAKQTQELSEKQVEKFKEALGANGKPVRMYGGAEAKELDDGTVLVKFPADDRGEDILKLVQRLLGDKININV